MIRTAAGVCTVFAGSRMHRPRCTGKMYGFQNIVDIVNKGFEPYFLFSIQQAFKIVKEFRENTSYLARENKVLSDGKKRDKYESGNGQSFEHAETQGSFGYRKKAEVKQNFAEGSKKVEKSNSCGQHDKIERTYAFTGKVC